jgi:hypothetical protein
MTVIRHNPVGVLMRLILILALLVLGGCATPSPNPSASSTGVVGDLGGYCDTACVRGLICSNHTCIKAY